MREDEQVTRYIETFPDDVRGILLQMRNLLRGCLPEATECMSYGIPTFKGRKNLVHFAAFKHHIGYYPGAECISSFKDRLAEYRSSKGAVQFPLDHELPWSLIRDIAIYRLAQD